MMHKDSRAFKNFEANITTINELLKLHELIRKDYSLLKIESEELLRSIIVSTVSALDNFLHDFYRTQIVDSYLGAGNFSANLDKVSVSLRVSKNLDSAFSNVEKKSLLDNELKNLQKTDSYQSPRSIENIFTNLNVKNIWSNLEPYMGMRAQEIKAELALIIERRNKISHESDWNYFNGEKNGIDYSDVKDVVSFINKLVLGIISLS